MPKRKANKVELESGIGDEEVEETGIEPEDAEEEKIVALACDEENDQDDEALIAEYHKYVKEAQELEEGE